MTVESEPALAVVGRDQLHDRRRPRAMPTAAPCSAPGHREYRSQGGGMLGRRGGVGTRTGCPSE